MRDRTQTQYFPFEGGLDLLSPPLSIAPGRVVYSKNYECDILNRYRSIEGFERTDGHLKPSDAVFLKVGFTDSQNQLFADDVVTGSWSGATGVVLVDGTLESGTYGGGDAAGVVILYVTSGAFVADEHMKIGALWSGRVSTRNAGLTEAQRKTWTMMAREWARDQIDPVPGAGDTTGVWIYNGDKYTFRNNVGQTVGTMWVESSSGWVQIDLGSEFAFTSGGTTEIVAGNTVTGSVSGSTALVTKVTRVTGAWADGDAAGYINVINQSAAFQAENLLVAAVDLATIAADSTANVLPAYGRYEFVNHNFYASTGTFAMFGANGVGPAFEYDGTGFQFVHTGMVTDTPDFIAAHANQLFLTFSGGSLQHSSPGTPHEWDAKTGADELGIGDEITGLIAAQGEALAIPARNSMSLLYGRGVSTWELRQNAVSSGALPYTVQRYRQPVYLDDLGITALSATNDYGDFYAASLSEAIGPFIGVKKLLAIASMVVKKKNQYRLFFSDGTGVSLTTDWKKVFGWMRFELGKAITCCCSGEDSDGNEVLLFGSDDGYVYELDSGTSFDGEEFTKFLRFPYNHMGLPQNDKFVPKISLELDAASQIELKFLADFYNNPSSVMQTFDLSASGGYWGDVTWGSFIWNGDTISRAEALIKGHSTYMSLFIKSTSDYDEPHTLHGVTIQYIVRRLMR